ncbi:proline racemase family protein [Tabrizicola oligotrophica]|uniref:Uncharacterized protein n=1 Tax=Tabrizicola oligotrophica TaxID=2710650 RepID=A0A6M0QYI4_9RHOB|nr:proline racemase family protein [Tabrizicola oligotrophica]NEY91522.1 hypothetical protein [Tabrizicola oligotrophica]
MAPRAGFGPSWRSDRLALLPARGEVAGGATVFQRAITGSRFACALGGQAWIRGLTRMGLDPDAAFQQGFARSDTWSGVLA